MAFSPEFIDKFWFLWWEHNKRRHGEKIQEASRLVDQIRTWIEYRSSTAQVSDMPKSTESPLKIWKPPNASEMKLNVDAAYDPSNGSCAAGFVIRNERGEVLLSAAVPIGFCVSVLQAELASICVALRTSLEAGFFDVEVASDNISTVHACEGKVDFADYLGVVIADIKVLISYFRNISFVYENRKANIVAHALAKWGVSLQSPEVLLEDIPPAVAPCVVRDMV